jgi:hypothetical protein
MEDPSPEELRTQAKFKVGDIVFLDTGGPWKVSGRYWSASRKSIVYDLVFEYSGVTIKRIEEVRLLAIPQYRPLT